MPNIFKAKSFLNYMVGKFTLCQKLCDLYKTTGSCFDYQVHRCNGACIGKELPEVYNERVDKAIESFSYQHDNFVIIGRGRESGGR